MNFEVMVENIKGYGRELQIYGTYSYIDIPAKSKKKLKNVSEPAIRYYEKCGFKVEKITKGLQTLNEVPEELGKTVFKKEEPVISQGEEIIPLNEIGIKQDVEVNSLELLKEKLQDFDVEMLRAVLSDVGENPRGLKNKEKLIKLVLKQDRKKVENLIKYSE